MNELEDIARRAFQSIAPAIEKKYLDSGIKVDTMLNHYLLEALIDRSGNEDLTELFIWASKMNMKDNKWSSVRRRSYAKPTLEALGFIYPSERSGGITTVSNVVLFASFRTMKELQEHVHHELRKMVVEHNTGVLSSDDVYRHFDKMMGFSPNWVDGALAECQLYHYETCGEVTPLLKHETLAIRRTCYEGYAALDTTTRSLGCFTHKPMSKRFIRVVGK